MQMIIGEKNINKIEIFCDKIVEKFQKEITEKLLSPTRVYGYFAYFIWTD